MVWRPQWLKGSRRISQPHGVPSATGEVFSNWPENQGVLTRGNDLFVAPCAVAETSPAKPIFSDSTRVERQGSRNTVSDAAKM